MALVAELKRMTLEREAPHREVDCTYSIITDVVGRKFLQVDTYGSSGRKFKGKKSQSIRLSPEAIKQLKRIIESEL